MRVQDISSKDNPAFRKLKTLLTSKGIKEEKSFFLMGEKIIQEFLHASASNVISKRFKVKSVACFENAPFPLLPMQIKLKKDMFNEIDVLGTDYPMLVLEYADFPEPPLLEKPQGLELIAPLGDPKNLGALLRSSVAFGASRVILTKESCHPFLPHSVKASAGAALYQNIFYTTKSISELPTVGENFALDLNGKNMADVHWPKDLRLWIGEEGPGLTLSDTQRKHLQRLTIPTTLVESLNATVSSSIALWEWRKNQISTLKLSN